MRLKIGDLKLKNGTTIRKIYYNCETHWKCEDCPHYGDICYGNITDIEIEPPQTVTHGVWVYDENAVDYNIGGYRCSVCGGRNDNLPADRQNPYLFARSRYCPQCGAKMDGKQSDAAA